MDNSKLENSMPKKLVALFILTIFIPCVMLSIFGIRTIRNEKRYLESEMENEYRRIARFVDDQLSSKFKEAADILESLAEDPAFIQKDFPSIRKLTDKRFRDNPLIDQIFLSFEPGEHFFPFLELDATRETYNPALVLDTSGQEILRRARESEFQKYDYSTALEDYQKLLTHTDDSNTRARIFNDIARSSKKQGEYDQAVETYKRILQDYPESSTSSGLPMAIPVELQIIECYSADGSLRNSLNRAFQFYENLLNTTWNLSEDQFTTYATLIKDMIASIEQNRKLEFSNIDRSNFERLSKLHEDKLKQFQTRRTILESIVPDLRNQWKFEPADKRMVNLTKRADNRLFLVSAVSVSSNPNDIAGISYNNNYLIRTVLPEILSGIKIDQQVGITIMDSSGAVLAGESTVPDNDRIFIEDFKDNFPPWEIGLHRIGPEAAGTISITQKLYFWTILTLIGVMIFGTVMISRAVAHERATFKLKSDFVLSVSHEFKTPLTSIRALTERMQNGKVTDTARMQTYFSIISQDVDRLARLVSNVLDFSKIEEGRKKYEFRDTDVAGWVRQIVDEYAEMAKQKGMDVRLHVSGTIPRLKIDPDALSQTIFNLLDNALKFSAQRNRIDVSLSSDKNRITLQVIDHGIGIEKEELKHIFDKFFRGKNALKQSIQGTGLGLTLAKHAVEAHGGRITAESVVGRGTTFTIHIPVP